MHVTEKQRRAAHLLSQPGAVIRTAMVEAGYSQSQANQGVAGIPNRVIKLMAKKGARFVELGGIDAATQEQLVRGRLVYNTIRGDDRGAMSAKVLGSDRRCNMFTPDVQVGVVVVNPPKEVQAIQSKEDE